MLAMLAAAGCAARAQPVTRPEPAAAAPPPPATTLAQSIDAYIGQPAFARADWGIAVHSLDSGQTLYAHNAGRLFVPASTVKLFTAGLALADLGSATRIATTLYATGARVDARGNLRGDLILYGRGDPSLGLPGASPDWADRLAAGLAHRGVKRVRGDLIVDATYFSGAPVGTGWEADDLQTWYGAAPSALNVAGNRVEATVTRSTHACCSIAVVPGAAGVKVINATARTADVPFGLYRPVGSDTLYVIGNQQDGRHVYTLSMPDPARAAGNLLREAMARHGIQLTGHTRVLRWPESDTALDRRETHAIATIESPPIAELVGRMLKDSDNLYAQSLLLQVGVAAAQRNDCNLPRAPDTSAAWGLCALRGMLVAAGIPPDAVLLSEGSGLARRDLVAPAALVQWLAWTAGQPWGADLRRALPIAGVDGTLEARLRNGTATDNLQAKTGTLSHTYTLAGFVTDTGGERLVFALMLNHYPYHEMAGAVPDAPAPRQALDEIARLLAQHGADHVAPGAAPSPTGEPRADRPARPR